MGKMCVVLVAGILFVGCVTEADRDAVDMSKRIHEEIVASGAAAGDAASAHGAVLMGKMTERLGAPLTPEPITAEAVAKVTSRIDEAIERDAYWAAKVEGVTTFLAGLVGLGGVAAAGWQTLKKSKEKRKVATMMEAGDRVKEAILATKAEYEDKAKDGKVDLADAIAIALSLKDKVGTTINDVATMRGVLTELADDYRAAKKSS